MSLDNFEVWRQIPPEEKIHQISRAQARGSISVLVLVTVGCSIAVGLRIEELIWVSMLLCPIVFQFTAGRAWRGARPKMMLEYLAARSAGRRYAFTSKSKNLGVDIIFRGEIEEIDKNRPEADDVVAEIEGKVQEATAWIVLFHDFLIGMKEKPGGAELIFNYPLDENLILEDNGIDEEEVDTRQVIADGLVITSQDHKQRGLEYRIKCPFPATIVAFDQKLKASIREVTLRTQRHEKMLAELRNRVAN